MSARRFPDGPPQLRALAFLRAMNGGRDFSGIPVFLADVARRYGGLAHWTIFGRHFYFLDDAALIEEAFVLRARDYKKGRGVQRLKRLLGNGLLCSEDPLHLRQRRMLQPAFHRERIAGYGEQMVALTLEHIARWGAGGVLELDGEMTRLTLAIAAATLFTTSVEGQSEMFRSALTAALRTFPASLSAGSELLDALPFLPVTRRFERARAQLDEVVYELIAARRRAPQAAGGEDLLGMLLAARDGAEAMDDAQVRDEAMTLFIAGHETTANALAWAWYLLARHPAVADRLRREIGEVLGGRAPAASDLPRLPYTRNVLAETMRLYPPAWVLGRRALRETKLGPYTVARGSVVLACQLVTQRSPRYWRDPDAFRPERWSDDPQPPRFAYFPFGGGSRRCIGESFAWMEGALLIATIAQRFTLATVDAAPVEVEPLVTLRPRTPIRLHVSARPASAAVPDCG
jgi:cytochrome P450